MEFAEWVVAGLDQLRVIAAAVAANPGFEEQLRTAAAAATQAQGQAQGLAQTQTQTQT